MEKASEFEKGQILRADFAKNEETVQIMFRASLLFFLLFQAAFFISHYVVVYSLMFCR